MTDNQVKIHLLVGIRGLTLLVFYTETDCWQFRFLSLGGAVFGERKIYFTAQAAEQAGRESIYKDFLD
ncbi:hypothetical protein [Anabaena azotica]|uniref:Uncharacterized protein n=1 Tax=Anabaena azotica FACHB-119 TaxID=947527 RepID=A0ABR8DDC2_9NOST|nr:hypothetical protein [Anabaena azotica]MBD2504927.1 hypothetical protein [Anabaena azotica FACHB-119]